MSSVSVDIEDRYVMKTFIRSPVECTRIWKFSVLLGTTRLNVRLVPAYLLV